MKKYLGMLLVFLLLISFNICFASTFTDISRISGEYAIERIAYMGIVNGTGNGKFEPNKGVTRAEFAKMIVSVVGKSYGENSKEFSDIKNHWGRDYIIKASSLGLINGYSDGTFRPDGQVTYAEAITMIFRGLGYYDLETSNEVWYAPYVQKMELINLNAGLITFNPEVAASREDISILLWNMLVSDSRANHTKTLLEENFSQYKLLNKKIISMTAYKGKVAYYTDIGAFFVQDNIDFSDIGGEITGLYDNNTKTLIGMKTDEGKNLIRIYGTLAEMRDMGYSPFTIENISGYGEKENARYVEIFIDGKTKEIYRTVYFDTSEATFAEKVKIGNKNVSIESKLVFDHSVIYLDDGSKLEYSFPRTESIKTISLDALLIHDGEIVDWKTLPNNAILKEIIPDEIYAYEVKSQSGTITSGSLRSKKIAIDGNHYNIAENAVAINISSKVTKKIGDGFSEENLKILIQKKDKVVLYFDVNDEVAKVEFTYDVWEEEFQKNRKIIRRFIKDYLSKTGIVVNAETDYLVSNDDIVTQRDIKYQGLPSSKLLIVSDDKSNYKIGNILHKSYTEENETKIEVLKGSFTNEYMKFEDNFSGKITSIQAGEYLIDEETKFIEVTLEKDPEQNESYLIATMEEVLPEDLENTDSYLRVALFIDNDGFVVRGYAFREVGIIKNIGIVSRIKEIQDDSPYAKLTLKRSDGTLDLFQVIPSFHYGIGDLVTFDTLVSSSTEPSILIEQVYAKENIGSSYDLVIKGFANKVITFKNSEDVIDLKAKSFTINGEEKYFSDYMFINAKVSKTSSGWRFESFKFCPKTKLQVRAGSRIAIDEISNTFISYSGF